MLFGTAALGKRDITPNVVNWPDLSFASPDTQSTGNQTLNGFIGSITLQITWTGSNLILEYQIDGGSLIPLTSGNTFSISNGQQLSFDGTRLTAGNNTVTVANQTAGGAVLDTFTVTAS